jgi:hypothetical protein
VNWAAFILAVLFVWLAVALFVGTLVGHGIALGAAETD